MYGWTTIAKTVCVLLAALFLVPSPSGDEVLELNLETQSTEIPDFDPSILAKEVASLVQINTISDPEQPFHLPPESQKNMKKAHKILEQFYPKLFSKAEKQTVDGFSLLLSLNGSDPLLRPALVMCHLDVVPIEEGTEKDWGVSHGCKSCGPFSGTIHDGFVWGRGALDMKSTCVTFLHAAEQLLRRKQGFSPARTIYFAIGHDEETKGDGHRKIAEKLHADAVELEAVLDEGNPTVKRGSNALSQDFDLALPALAEKGAVSLRLVVNFSAAEAGHAAFPPATGTAITVLAGALERIHAGQPAPTLERPTADLLRAVSAVLPFPASFVLDRLVLPRAACIFPSRGNDWRRGRREEWSIRSELRCLLCAGEEGQKNEGREDRRDQGREGGREGGRRWRER